MKLLKLGPIGFSLLFPFTALEISQRSLRDVASRELIQRLYADGLTQAVQAEIRKRMTEVAVYGIEQDRELVEAPLETLDSKNVKVMVEAIMTLSGVRDQTVRKRLLQLLSSESDSMVKTAVLASLAYSQGMWPVDDRDIDNIKSIVRERSDSIEGDINLKGSAILALGTLGAVTALEDLRQYEGVRQAYGHIIDAGLERARRVKKSPGQ